MIKLQLAFLAAAMALAGIADAQAPTRVRGSITAFDDKVLSVKSPDGKSVSIDVGEDTQVVFTQPIKLSEIKPGDFLALTSKKREDGSLTAFEVRRFPKPSNPGHRPFAGRDDQTMTNATVSSMVQSASGREVTVTYEGGSQKIMVPENASISMLVPGQRSQLVPGAPVNIAAVTVGNSKLTARQIQVGPVPNPGSAGTK